MDNLQAHIVFFMGNIRYNCVVRFVGWIQGVRRICVFSGNGRKNI